MIFDNLVFIWIGGEVGLVVVVGNWYVSYLILCWERLSDELVLESWIKVFVYKKFFIMCFFDGELGEDYLSRWLFVFFLNVVWL